MKKVFLKTFLLACFCMTAGLAMGQSANLRGKAMAAAHDCIQSFEFLGYGLITGARIDVVGTCPDGSDKYAVTIFKVGHCPKPDEPLCLVPFIPMATVTFDCNENVQSIVCFN